MSSVPEFWAIDFDRCIGNVDTIYRLFERIAKSVIPTFDVSAMESARFELESAGGSFDMLAHVRQYASDESVYQAVVEVFLREAAEVRDNLLNTGVRELMEYLEQRSAPYGIVSFGHIDWQTLKIIAVGLGDVPRLIVDNHHKGEVIAGWRQGDGFALPADLSGSDELVSTSIILVDDKAVSFIGLPADARGYWARPAELLPSQQGDIPNQVVSVKGLEGVIVAEENRPR